MPYAEHFIIEGIRFTAFVFVCGCLLQPRFKRRNTILIAVGFLLGILAIQVSLLIAGHDETLILTLLPVTAYIPAIIGVHVLSRSGFPQTVSVWSAGVLISFTLLFFQKLLGTAFVHTAVAVLIAAVVLSGLVFFFLRRPYRTYVLENQSGWLLMSFPAVMLFLLFSYWANTVTDPMLLLLIFLTALSVIGVMIWALASAASLRRMKATEQAMMLQQESQRREYEALRQKMEQDRRYRHDMRHHFRVLEGLFDEGKSVEGLQYISTLNGQLTELEQENCCENATVNAVLRSYMGRAREENCQVTVKAEIPQACPVDEIDLCVVLANGMDNAINACRSNAQEANKWIRISVLAHENGNLSVKIENPCDQPVIFGRDGLPKSQSAEQHGIGLKSVEAVVKKYDGILQCERNKGIFSLRAVLFEPAGDRHKKKKKSSKTPVNALMTVLLGLFLINCMPDMAQALETVPVLGPVIRLANVHTYQLGWGDTSFTAKLPVLEEEGSPSAESAQGSAQPTTSGETPAGGTEDAHTQAPPMESSEPSHGMESQPATSAEENLQETLPPSSQTTGTESVPAKPPVPEPSRPVLPSQPSITEPIQPPVSETDPPADQTPSDPSDGMNDMNQQMEEYIAEVRETFLWYVARKYQGYVASVTDYHVLRDDDEMLSLCFYTTINAGGSGEYSRCFTLDKRTGQVIKLSDLFAEGSDYVGVISADILRQMTEQVQAGEGDYFIPGGIWSEDECFKAIDADQNFYLDEDNRLVILFDEYEVAPGSMGMPRFVIDDQAIAGILAPWLEDMQAE